MFTIYIFADTYKLYATAVKEYEKRLWKQLKIIHLKPEKWNNPAEIIKKETQKYIDIIEKNSAYNIVLSPTWKSLVTQDFYELIEQKKQITSQFCFFIWWADWLDYSLLKNTVDLELSLSSFTMPHWLALTVLSEQIYRICMMKKGTQYNK